MTCPCRHHEHPRPIDIPPGLTRLDRMVANIGEFRRALLTDASAQSRLASWSAREPGDLGVLLIEMWAVACGIVAFADETICHECFVRTARRDDSLRRLIALLGYRPRPAVAATVDVSLRVSGREAVSLPAGTAFRSGSVGEHPPQVFELLADALAHPLANSFPVSPGTVDELGETTPGTGVATLDRLTVLVEGTGLVANALVRVVVPTAAVLRRLERVEQVKAPGRAKRVLEFDAAVELPATTNWDDLTVEVADFSASLWTLDVTGFSQAAVSTSGGITTLTLDGLHRRFGSGQPVVLERAGFARWFTITSVQETTYRLAPDVEYTFDGDDYTLPGASTLVTRLVLDTSIDDAARRQPGDADSWGDDDTAEITVRGGWRLAGRAEAPAATELADSVETVDVGADLDTPWTTFEPGRFTVVDRDGRAVTATGALDWATGEVRLDEAAWEPPLRHPIRVDANVATATRGESVFGEVLGSGNAALAGQVFALANSPLTRLGPAASGGDEPTTTTLTVWVDGVRWDEIPHFVGAGPRDRVYVTRETDDGITEVVFGNGTRGARLPTGDGNVVADYRFGAGAIHPGPGSIAQLVEPVEAVTGVINRTAAYGGADAEGPDELRDNAPRSALLLGRVVSRHDAVTVARQTPGVVAAVANLEWRPDRLNTAIEVRYIGDPGLAEGLRRRLRALTERDVRIDAVVSPPHPIAVTVTLVADPRRRRDDVSAAVVEALLGDGGALTPAVLGIDGPLFRSRLFAAVVAVDGVEAVTGALVDGVVFEHFAVVPPPGGHLDATGSLTIVLEEVADGGA